MMRRVMVGAVGALMVCCSASAQEWAEKMFEATSHDFGSVAAGSKTEYEFVLKNIYIEDVHVASVRASCGCTTPSIKNPTLKTYQKGAIVATYNTSSFQGAKGATVTVTFDKPFYAEVQLQVRGYIRRDVVVNPGSVQFGSIDAGTSAERTVSVNYAGRSDWEILEVKCPNPHLSAKAVPVSRNGGQISYNVVVRVDGKAPAGYVRDHLILVTNDRNMKDVPVAVEGVVRAGIVAPSTLFLGMVQPGQKVTMPLVVKGKKPFSIVSITSDGEGLAFDRSKDEGAKLVHVIPVTFVAGNESGKVTRTIRIETDQADSAPVLSAYAVVTAGK